MKKFEIYERSEMKLQRYDVFDDNYRPNDDGDWCAAEAVEELEAENETLLAEIERLKYCFGVLFIDSLGAKRKSVDECRGKVEYVEIGGTIYWPLSERDKERLIAASCGNGIFDGPSKAPPQEVDR
ncbi:hypothetical protein HFV02_08215 [Acidithiobacillus caldus]|jgi:hypothetical protein|nr:hypothetical protein [Acidithiobacillus caldus]